MVIQKNDGRKDVMSSAAFAPQRPMVQRALMLDLLDQIQRLFDEFREHQLRYTKKHTTIFKRDPKSVPDDQSSKEAGEVEPRIRQWMARVFEELPATTKEGWNRLRWASWDMGELENLIQQFGSLNDTMRGLLDSKIQQQIADTTQDTYRVVVQMATSVDQLMRFVNATQAGVQNPDLARYQELAKFKAFQSLIQDDIALESVDDKTLRVLASDGESVRRDLRIDESLVEVCPDGASNQYHWSAPYRSRGVYQVSSKISRDIWIEWRSYRKYLKRSATDEDGPPEAVVDSVKKLAQLLNHKDNPTEFRVPRCLGYFQDKKHGRFGFVFKPTEGNAMKALPRTLLQLIQDTVDGKMKKPSVTHRIELGKALTSSLLYLHTADWLHKALRSDNVLFLDKAANGQPDLTRPTLSGFEVARPMINTTDTQKPEADIEIRMYRHPESLHDEDRPDKPYCKTFDIYSLGVVLVEIALWKPIDKVLTHFDEEKLYASHPRLKELPDDDSEKIKARKDGVFDKTYATSRPTQQKKIKEKLLRDAAITAVEAELGQVYRTVVKCCLTGRDELGLQDGDNEAEASVGAKLGEAYYKKVVSMLQEIRI